MSPKKDAQEPDKGTTASGNKYVGFSKDERDAMKQYLKEKRGTLDKEAQESEVLAKIAEMEATDRAMAERIHAIIKANAPVLSPKLWYGMPAYAREGKIICFFQPALKFKTRYATFGFNDSAKLDDGHLWPVAFAVNELTPAEEARIVALVKKAVG